MSRTDADRERRLGEALRANLGRRKAQERADPPPAAAPAAETETPPGPATPYSPRP